MPRWIKRVGLAGLAMTAMLSSSLPAIAASNGVNCNTYSNSAGTASIKLCFTVYEETVGSVWQDRAQVNFCQWYPGDPCDATQLDFDSLRLRREHCSESAGSWYTQEERVNFQFDPRNFSNTHTEYAPAWSVSGWWQTFADFRIKWPNGVWSGTKSAQSTKVYDDGSSPDCPNRY
jgi:hypothetical protein